MNKKTKVVKREGEREKYERHVNNWLVKQQKKVWKA